MEAGFTSNISQSEQSLWMPTQGSHDQMGGYNIRGITDASSSSLRAAFQRCGSATQLLSSNRYCPNTLFMNIYYCTAVSNIRKWPKSTADLIRRYPLQGMPISDTARQFCMYKQAFQSTHFNAVVPLGFECSRTTYFLPQLHRHTSVTTEKYDWSRHSKHHPTTLLL